MRFTLFIITVFIFLSVIHSSIFGQADSLVFKNGNYMVGEVKTMTRGVLTIETDYSDDDFTIEWDGIKDIYTGTYFLITLSDGSRYNGNVNSSGPNKIKISTREGLEVEVAPDQIVWLDDVDQGFWSQLYASIDVGFDITKASNLRQISTRATLGYIAERWKLDGS